jgi:hypothetical protein
VTTGEQRAHAILGASAWKKWSKCTMSAAVEQTVEEEPEQPWTREGTCAHAVGEVRLINWLGLTAPFNGLDESEVKDYSEFHTQEFSDHVQEYVDHVISNVTMLREQHGHDAVIVLLEQRLDFSRWVPEGFGTGDVVVVYPGGIWVADLKFGAGVAVTDTGQLRLYGLGALDRYSILYDIHEVSVTIIQPRKENILTETLTTQELLTWADELVVPRAKIAWAAVQGDRSQARFSPGEHCSNSFCKARFTCAARSRYMLEAAEQPFAGKDPDVLTVEQLESVVDRARLAVKWLSDCERYLVSQAAAGKVKMAKHELVQGRSFRVITDEAQAATVLMQNGYAASDIYADPKLRGLGALEKLVGAKNFQNLMGDILVKPPGTPTLAPIGSGRPKAASTKKSAAEEFNDCE